MVHIRQSTRTNQLPLSVLKGWWQSIVSADFDGDGRPDLAAGNWGRNSVYELYRNEQESPRLTLFAGALGGTTEHDLFLAYLAADGRWWPVSPFTEVSPIWPRMAARFPTHRAYAAATAEEILTDHLPQLVRHEVNFLDSIVLLNRGNYFDLVLLPAAAQLSPVFGLVAVDFNQDGQLDLVLAQNFSRHGHLYTRDDAGTAQVLLGRGDGTFQALESGAAGIRIDGEQRSVLSFPTGSGRGSDLVVTGPAGRVWRYRTLAP